MLACTHEPWGRCPSQRPKNAKFRERTPNWLSTRAHPSINNVAATADQNGARHELDGLAHGRPLSESSILWMLTRGESGDGL